MAQRTHTPLHTGDESPSCGLCCRRARLKLTAPTATLDTPSPISSTESTKRLPIIWPLVHILPWSSFLPDQRGKPTIHLLSSSISLPLPAPNPKTFLSSPVKHNPQRLAFQNRRPSSLTRPEAKEPLHPLARSDRDRRRICPGSVVGVQERGAHQLQGFQEGAGNLEEPGRQESRSRGAVQSSASSQVSAGKARSPVAPRPLRALRRGSALLPGDPKPTCSGLLSPSPSPARLLSFVFLVAQSAPASPSVPRLSGWMIFSTTLLAVAVSPEKATLSDGLFPSGFLLPPCRPRPPPLS